MAAKGRPASGAGVRFSSRLNRSISSTTRGSAVSARTAWLQGQGAALAVDQAQLQLRPEGGRAGPEARPLQQPLQRRQAFLEPQLEAR